MKYNIIKNYIHNDLRITKEDIRGIIEETVKTEIHKILNDEPRIKQTIEDEIIRCCKVYNSDGERRSFVISTMDDIYNKIDKEIHNIVRENLIVSLREKSSIKEKPDIPKKQEIKMHISDYILGDNIQGIDSKSMVSETAKAKLYNYLHTNNIWRQTDNDMILCNDEILKIVFDELK